MLKEAWALAIETLSWMEMRRLSERQALAKTVKQLGIENSSAIRLAHMLVCETVRRQNFISKFINNVTSPLSIDEFSLGVQAFLRLYVYQTRMLKNRSKFDVEEAEAVARLARSILGWKSLQKVEQFLGELLTQNPASVLLGVDDTEKIALMTFHPKWFVDYCFKLLGRREAIALLETDTQTSPTYVRFNTLKADKTDILDRLAEEGIEVEKVPQLSHAYEMVNAKKPITQTTSFMKGLFYVQDKASCFAAEASDVRPGMTVLDVCAAPGAKTTYLAQLMQNRGVVYSLDYSRRRMNVWKSEVNRMGVEIATPIVANACSHLPLKVEADVVILDPPCTGSGVFRKSPSAKWRLTEHSIDNMQKIQWLMLDNCAENVRSKGSLLYSTCSITVEENERLIERFLKWHPEFSLTHIVPKIGLPGLRGLEECQRLYPHIHQCNGFFIAKLLKE